MNESPLVSVVLTTYKRKPYMVKRAVDSVLNQTYTNIELIIIDDSPSDYEFRDDIASMIKSISDNRIVYVQHKENRGACLARNTGIDKSCGEFIMYFDDDDELLPDKVLESLNKFNSKYIGLVYSQNYVIDENKNCEIRINESHTGYVFDELIKENFVLAFPLIRRECFQKCGLFDAEMLSMQDYELWLRIAKEFKFEHVPKPLSNVYHHKNERISTDPRKKIQAAKEIISRYHLYLNKNPNVKNTKLMRLAIFYSRDKDIKNSINIWFKAVISHPFKFHFNLKYTYIVFQNLFRKFKTS